MSGTVTGTSIDGNDIAAVAPPADRLSSCPLCTVRGHRRTLYIKRNLRSDKRAPHRLMREGRQPGPFKRTRFRAPRAPTAAPRRTLNIKKDESPSYRGLPSSCDSLDVRPPPQVPLPRCVERHRFRRNHRRTSRGADGSLLSRFDSIQPEGPGPLEARDTRS